MTGNESKTVNDGKGKTAILYNIIRIFKCKDVMEEKVLGTVEKEQMIDSALHYLREQYKEHSGITKDINNVPILDEIDQHVLIDKKKDYFTEENGYTIMMQKNLGNGNEYEIAYEVIGLRQVPKRNWLTLWLTFTRVECITVLDTIVVKKAKEKEEEFIDELKNACKKRKERLENGSMVGFNEAGEPVFIQ